MWSLHFIEPYRSLADAVPYQYDYRLVLLSVIVAAGASYASFLASERLFSTARTPQGLAWLLAGALALGGGVWSMHFIGMLAVRLPVDVAYDPLTTLVSLVPVILASGLAILPQRYGRLMDTMAMRSLTLGSGIGAMHYIGMMAIRTEGLVMRYEPALFVLSIVVAVVLAYLALWIRRRAQRQVRLARRAQTSMIAASLVMGLAISGMHYTGMASMYYFPGATHAVASGSLAPGPFALIILLVMCGLLVILITAVYFSRTADLLNRLSLSEQRLKTLLETVPSGLLTVDAEGVVRSANRAAEQMFAAPVERIVGQRLERLLICPDGQGADAGDCDLRVIERCASEHARLDLQAERSDGSRFPISVLAASLDDAGERLYVVVVNDITQRKQLEASLTREKEEAEAANRAKSTFLAAMSHEIRTPMNGVVGMVDVLRQSPLDDAQRDTLATIKESAFSLLRILDDILDFSKIEAGKLAFESVPLSIERILEGVCDTLRPLADRKGSRLILLTHPGLPARMQGDPVRVRQVLFNLVGNAIKFSGESPDRPGEVVVLAEPLSAEDGGRRVRIRIQDNGIGIAPEVQKTLFRSFVQAESSTTRRFGGTGLGLVISKRLVDLMGGGITLDSRLGDGACFTVELPVQAEAADPDRFQTDLAGIHALVVTDHPHLGPTLCAQLEDMGARVDTCPGNRLSDCLVARPQDGGEQVVVLDGGLEPGHAQGLRDALRERLGDKAARYVILDVGQRGAARMEQGDSVVLGLNAMNRTSLLRAVAAVCGRSSIEPQVPEAGAFALPEDEGERARRAGLRVLLAEDNGINRQVLSRQMGLLGYHVDMAGDGREALRMWREGDYHLVLTDCHMPELDGYGLAEAIRAEEGDGAHVPIIAITADALTGTRRRCLASGMDDYLSKPVQLSQLAPMLEKWLGTETAGADTPAPAADGPDGAEVVDAGFLARIIGVDDPGVLAGIYREFASSGRGSVDAIVRHAAERDAAGMGTEAHKLKSAARAVGANALADCCARLERAARQGDWAVLNRDSENIALHFDDVVRWIERRPSGGDEAA